MIGIDFGVLNLHIGLMTSDPLLSVFDRILNDFLQQSNLGFDRKRSPFVSFGSHTVDCLVDLARKGRSIVGGRHRGRKRKSDRWMKGGKTSEEIEED